MPAAITKPKRRKRLIVTDEILTEVKFIAGLGMTNEQIGYYYGMGPDCWTDYKAKYPELDIAMKTGKSETGRKVMGKLYEAIEKNNLTAIIFYLKTQFRWREVDSVKPGAEEGEKGRLPAITLNVNDPVEAAKIYQEIMLRS